MRAVDTHSRASRKETDVEAKRNCYTNRRNSNTIKGIEIVEFVSPDDTYKNGNQIMNQNYSDAEAPDELLQNNSQSAAVDNIIACQEFARSYGNASGNVTEEVELHVTQSSGTAPGRTISSVSVLSTCCQKLAHRDARSLNLIANKEANPNGFLEDKIAPTLLSICSNLAKCLNRSHLIGVGNTREFPCEEIKKDLNCRRDSGLPDIEVEAEFD